jgi:hypothetical protein
MNSKACHINPLKTFILLFFISLLFIYPVISSADDWIYTTRPDDTLWDISKKYLKSANYWKRLQQHNRHTLTNPSGMAESSGGTGNGCQHHRRCLH